MLEILALIYLCKRIKNIVEPKGYTGRRWQLYVVLCWFGLEIVGVVFSMLAGSDLMIAVFSGLLCAIGGAIALQRYAQSLPNQRNDEWLKELGNQDPY